MMNDSDVSTRRVLTFPAVRPCESVSPATLLNSLINLASNTCDYRSKLFSTNNRISRKSIRIIGVLSILFEEIQENLSLFSLSKNSLVLSLSELHFIFQNLQFLLQDSTRDGARLWMLMKSNDMASQFHALLRAAATAVDVLLLVSTSVSVEARELVQLAMKQARKSEFELDPVDKLALKNVISIFSQFEERIIPERGNLKWVLSHLGIRRWSECDREIKFLESEKGFEELSSEKRDLGLLSSLIGLLTYCRGVIFDVVDNSTLTKQYNDRCRSKVIRHLNSEDFICPISLEIMTDPVTLSTGHTYDRSSIQKWFKSGKETCPKTGEKLNKKDMVPNSTLKQLISQYCYENSIPVAEKGIKKNITSTVYAGSLAAEEAIKMLANFLTSRLETGVGEERNRAAFEVRVLTKSSIFNRSCLAEKGAIPPLLNLLSSTDLVAQENSIAALLNLSKHSKSKAIIVENGGVESILRVLKEGVKIEARQHAAGTLFYLASVEEYRVLIGETPGAIPGLMELLRDGNERGKKNALVAIFGLLMHPDNHRRVVSSGLVPLLASLLRTFEREDLVNDCLAVLATIAEKNDGAMAILRGGIFPEIVEILNSTTSRVGKEYCVCLLLALCMNGGGYVAPVLVKNPSLMAPLYALLTEGSSRARKKASSLIRLLHEFHERSSSSNLVIPPDFPRERFVHVW